MRKLLLTFLLLPVLVGAADPTIEVTSMYAVPSLVAPGEVITVIVEVEAVTTEPLVNVQPSIGISIEELTPEVDSLGDSDPLFIDYPTSQVKNFTYTFSATTCGKLRFTASAMGYVQAGGATVTASAASSNQVIIQCATPTPTPTAIAQPGHPATPTPIPVIDKPTSKIYGNVYKSGSGRPMELRYELKQDYPVTIRIFNRNGRVLRTITTRPGPGQHIEFWDGRSDSGALIASGIYIVHFQSNGLNQKHKIAIIK